LFFLWKVTKARGLFAFWALSSSLGHRAAAWRLQETMTPPPTCHLLLPGDEVTPWRLPSKPRCLHPSLSLAALLLLPRSLPARYSSRRSLPSAAVRRCPDLPRRAEKVCLVVLYLLVQGIEPRWPESPAPSWIPRRKRAPPPPKFIVSGHPPAKPTSPAGSR
jgi:hypothetical protein